MMAGREFDEGGPGLAPDALGLAQQRPPDAPLACTGVDDDGQDAQDRIVMLEPRQGGRTQPMLGLGLALVAIGFWCLVIYDWLR